MAFNSFEFLLLLPISVVLYFILDSKYRWILLLVTSYVFYMFWNPWYIFLIVGSTLIDYVCGLGLDKAEHRRRRKGYLFLSLFVNLGLLFLFKYLDFFTGTINDIASILNMQYAIPALKLLLPVGISFYTFQTLSYTIDVYYKKLPAERHLGYFALYVSFFPQLVAGPIERATSLIPQLRAKKTVDYDRITSGLKLIGFGLFKKVVIADQCGILVDNYFSQPQNYHGFVPFWAMFLFIWQIYCDFSGYSDIAIGSAKILGFDLMINFKRPFLGRSTPELWQRWHISLTTWFRDYIFVPLSSGERRKNYLMFYLFLIFLISGFWHGASWNFVIWGSIQGLIIVFYKYSKKWRNRIKRKKLYVSNQWTIKKLEVASTSFVFLFYWCIF